MISFYAKINANIFMNDYLECIDNLKKYFTFLTFLLIEKFSPDKRCFFCYTEGHRRTTEIFLLTCL